MGICRSCSGGRWEKRFVAVKGPYGAKRVVGALCGRGLIMDPGEGLGGGEGTIAWWVDGDGGGNRSVNVGGRNTAAVLVSRLCP